MKHEIVHKPSSSLLKVELKDSESIMAESGAMIYMDTDLEVQTKSGSGIFSALARKFLGSESFFFNIFTAKSSSRLGLAPDLPGDIIHLSLKDETLIVQPGSYLCSSTEIMMKPHFRGLKSLLGREGAFLLDIKGSGDLFLNAYGSIIELEIDGSYILDTGHLVAFDPALEFRIKKVGSWKSTLFSGEGFVFEFKGQGKIYMQSRVQTGFISWLAQLIRFKK